MEESESGDTSRKKVNIYEISYYQMEKPFTMHFLTGVSRRIRNENPIFY